MFKAVAHMAQAVTFALCLRLFTPKCMLQGHLGTAHCRAEAGQHASALAGRAAALPVG